MSAIASSNSDWQWFDLGVAALQQGRAEAAVQAFRRDLVRSGPHVGLYRALAGALLRLGRPARAAEALLQALVLLPHEPETLRQLEAATRIVPSPAGLTREQWSTVVSDLDPHGPFGRLTSEFAIAQADQLQGAGRLGAALDWCLKAIVLAPDDHLHAARASDLFLRMGRVAEGRELLRRAAELSPSAAAFQQVGRLSEELHDFPAARQAYERALALDSQYVPALCAAGHLLQDEGRMDEARGYLTKSLALNPDPLVRIVSETGLPPIYESLEDLRTRRHNLERNLRRIVEEGVTIDPTERIVPTTFYTAYHGLNDRAIAECYGRIYRPTTDQTVAAVGGARSRKIRIGFLSRFFCRHTIGRLNIGTVRNLARERFEVFVIAGRQPDDPMAHDYAKAADQFYVLPDQPRAAQNQLRQLKLDVLFFTDIGMDPLTYSLSFTRSAPIQCVTWGHPITTGSPCMDYFISSERLEVPEAQDHYSERLVRLPELAVHYPRPQLPANSPGRSHFGFAPEDHLYGCPQTLFKFHPEFDDILARILEQDPRGRLLLIEGRHAHWTEALRARLALRLRAAIERVHFLPRLSWPEFMAVNAFVDVLLDPIHFGGGNTTYEALALGKPVVSWPGQFLRSRITRALYDRMGFTDCLVDTPDQYVELAVRLGTDGEFRQHIRQRILSSTHVLYDDVTGIRQLEQFWEKVVTEQG